MTITGTAESDTDKLAQKCYAMMKNMYKKEYSEFLNMFYGIQVSKIVNEAGKFMNAIPEPFLMLNLCLPEESQKNNKSCTLIDCFNNYTLVDDYFGSYTDLSSNITYAWAKGAGW